jgi:hypothetical protein
MSRDEACRLNRQHTKPCGSNATPQPASQRAPGGRPHEKERLSDLSFLLEICLLFPPRHRAKALRRADYQPDG